jgi:hypothetical protein
VLRQSGLSLWLAASSGFNSIQFESRNACNSLELNQNTTPPHALNRFSPVTRVERIEILAKQDFTSARALHRRPNALIKLIQEIPGVAL